MLLDDHQNRLLAKYPCLKDPKVKDNISPNCLDPAKALKALGALWLP